MSVIRTSHLSVSRALVQLVFYSVLNNQANKEFPSRPVTERYHCEIRQAGGSHCKLNGFENTSNSAIQSLNLTRTERSEISKGQGGL
ncbi:hypothetical protein NPIL_71911 [Nephila pilipes]|uniref:Uncharacterized protein n=1 Tax=Nephila pilipes TaxID=299642 RepID=A0A8X6NHU8_NEPPI|nr:hypothetical protein NPIL_71911 [Nephila pilipes]